MREDHIWAWIQVATWEDLWDPSQWNMAVGLIEAAFRKGHLADYCTWQTIILIPKG